MQDETDRINLTLEERKIISDLAAKKIADVKEDLKLCREIANLGWIAGEVLDYRLTSDGIVQIRGKNGVIVNRFLPKDWAIHFTNGRDPIVNCKLKRISLDPRTLANNSDGLFIVAHEVGHALHFEQDPTLGESRKEESSILRKIEPLYILSHLREMPSDQVRAHALTRAYNLMLEDEAGASEFGLPVARGLGTVDEVYCTAAINKSLMHYFNWMSPVVAVAVNETTELRGDDVIGDMYTVQPEKGIASRSVVKALVLQPDVTVDGLDAIIKATSSESTDE